MQDLALRVAGALALFAALAHSVIGERYVFPVLRVEPQRFALLLRLIWHCLSVGWAGGGLFLLALPLLGEDRVRFWAIAVFALIFAAAALTNCIATQGRHFGWMVLAAAALLSLAGLR